MSLWGIFKNRVFNKSKTREQKQVETKNPKDQEKHPTIELNELVPYERNARTHSSDQLDKIKNSINEFGFINPVIIDENNMILVGHGRAIAAKNAGLSSVPYKRVTNLTEDQKKAYIIADNKLSDLAGWDEELLQEELESIDLDMSLFGFDEIDEPEIEINDDDFELNEDDVPTGEPIAKPGDIYELGQHRLMCGDSTDPEDVDKLLNGALADLVVTDPPYNVNVSNSQGMTIVNDKMNKNDFFEFLTAAFRNLTNNLKEGGAFYIWYASSEEMNFRTACNLNKLNVKQTLIWVKNHFNLGRSDYQWKHEPCLYGWKDGKNHYFTNDRTWSTVIEDRGLDFNNIKKEQAIALLKNIYEGGLATTVIKENKPLMNDLHPTMKPINLIARLIHNSSRKNENVMDLFGGSGSTLITCEQLNRKCYTMEIDPQYVDVIINRWEQFTGQKAVKIN